MDGTEWVFCITIAILYPVFFVKLINQVSGYNDIQDHHPCPKRVVKSIRVPWNEEDPTCVKQRQQATDEIEFRRHLALLLVALAGVIGSSLIQTGSTKLGVGLGGILTLMSALCMYWSRYRETTRIIISGLSLLVVVFLSIRLYKIDRISDIFSPEFGTK